MEPVRGLYRSAVDLLIVVVASVGIITPCPASESFSTDKPSPLKLANPRHGRVAHFTGNVELSGPFLVRWELVNRQRSYLRVIFFPDNNSAALLPHAAEGGPVKELLFPDAERAVSILLDSGVARRIFDKELLSARGEATLTIGDYRTVVDCDHRWYMARLISASKKGQIVAGALENAPFGC